MLVRSMCLNFRRERNEGKDGESPYLAPGTAFCVPPN